MFKAGSPQETEDNFVLRFALYIHVSMMSGDPLVFESEELRQRCLGTLGKMSEAHRARLSGNHNKGDSDQE